MDGSPRVPFSPELRERWQRRSDAAFERMYGDKNQEQLVTMTEREDMAVLIAKELAAFLLEEHIARDAAVRPDASKPPCCPKCGQAGASAAKPGEKLPDREVRTRAGDVRMQRERWRCAKCRIIFFSARRSTASGHGGIQPAVGAEGGAASE